MEKECRVRLAGQWARPSLDSKFCLGSSGVPDCWSAAEARHASCALRRETGPDEHVKVHQVEGAADKPGMKQLLLTHGLELENKEGL